MKLDSFGGLNDGWSDEKEDSFFWFCFLFLFAREARIDVISDMVMDMEEGGKHEKKRNTMELNGIEFRILSLRDRKSVV